MMILAPRLGLALGWQSVWWFGAGFSLVALVLYGYLIRVPPPLEEETAESAAPDVGFGSALANRDIWLLALAFCMFNTVFMPLATYYPTYLAEVQGYALADASLIASVATILVLISAPLAGWISDRIGSRKLILSVPFLIVGAMMLFPFRVVGWQIYAFMGLLGLVAGAVPTATFAAAAEVMAFPRLAGLGLAVVMVGQNLGMLVAPVAFGALVEANGWVAAGYWLIPVAIVGFFAAWWVRIR
jgi:predicted MFS family arabinose efflux permease